MDQIFTVSEAAERLKISTRTLYELARTGQITYRKVGGSYRFLPEDLAGILTLRPAKPRKRHRA